MKSWISFIFAGVWLIAGLLVVEADFVIGFRFAGSMIVDLRQ